MLSSRTCVGVVFGGDSGEHAVSILSAITVVKALRGGENRHHFDVIPIYIDKKGFWNAPEIGEQVLTNGIFPKEECIASKNERGFISFPVECEKIQVWFPVLHGPNGEDGSIQGLFQLTKKPFVGSGVLASALGMDKVAMKAAFSAAGLSQVPYQFFNASDLNNEESLASIFKNIESAINYPCFVKPANLGSSLGISKVFERKQLKEGLQQAASFDQRIIVEQGVQARELECAVLGGNEIEASIVGEIIFNADWYDYETKYSSEHSQALIPAPLPPSIKKEVQEQALKAFNTIDAKGLARVDFFYDDVSNQLWINEINTLPGFTSQSMYPMLWEASGLTTEDLVCKLVQTASNKSNLNQ